MRRAHTTPTTTNADTISSSTATSHHDCTAAMEMASWSVSTFHRCFHMLLSPFACKVGTFTEQLLAARWGILRNTSFLQGGDFYVTSPILQTGRESFVTGDTGCAWWGMTVTIPWENQVTRAWPPQTCNVVAAHVTCLMLSPVMLVPVYTAGQRYVTYPLCSKELLRKSPHSVGEK